MDSVRFRQDKGLIDSEGLVSAAGACVRLEYQLKDGVFGVVKSKVRELEIPLADLASVEVVRGWFGGCKIVLQARSMQALQKVPGMARGRVELIVDRADRAAAERLVAGLRKPTMPDGRGLDF